MKLVALAFALMLVGALAHADVIDPNTHSIHKCVKITGLDVYSGYAFIGTVSGPGPSSNLATEIVQIANSECIVTGAHYKFDRFSVYYANKSYIDRVGISGIKTGTADQYGRRELQDGNLVKVGGSIVSAPYAAYYVDDWDTSKNVTLEYGVESGPDGIFLTDAKVVKDGANPLQAFWCWLMGIFGGKC